jgi:hypothetical protein
MPRKTFAPKTFDRKEGIKRERRERIEERG